MSWPWIVAIVITATLAFIALFWLIWVTDELLLLKEESARTDDRHDRDLESLRASNYHLSAQVSGLIPLITSDVDEETDEAVETLKAIAAELES